MSEQQLLELAAKAAGRVFHWDGAVLVLDDPAPNECSAWNPLTDDADALRLAVRLGMCVDQGYEIAFANVTIAPEDDSEDANHAEAHELYTNHGGDALAATRRAIVLAAARLTKEPA